MELNRRNFLFGSAAAATFAGCATYKTGLRQLKPGEKRTVAAIGCGCQQRNALLPQFLGVEKRCAKLRDMVRVVAVCDCDRQCALAAAKIVNDAYGDDKCRVEYDFRKIIADPTIDAVCIATPDHWHAYICVEAMKHGKDVYCEKPLTYSIDEARKVIAAQKKYGRVFQTGSMQRSWSEVSEFRTACMIVRNGYIGNVRYVDANFGQMGRKHGGPSHPVRFFDEPENAAKEGETNPNVDWNMWLGPATWRPYSEGLSPRGAHNFCPMFWRLDDDLASGMNGDWGAHHLDTAQWGLDMDKSGPYKVVRSDEPYSTDLHHGGRRQFGVKLIFKKPYGDVELYHGPFSQLDPDKSGWGTVFYGTDGIVAVNRGRIAVWKGTGLIVPTTEIRKQLEDVSFMPEKIVAQSLGQQYGKDPRVKEDNRLAKTLEKLIEYFKLESAPVQLYKCANHVVNFCECVETREMTVTPAEVGGRSATLCQLCNLSYRYDTGFEWDGEKMDFADGNPKGISLKRDVYRNGWEVVV